MQTCPKYPLSPATCPAAAAPEHTSVAVAAVVLFVPFLPPLYALTPLAPFPFRSMRHHEDHQEARGTKHAAGEY